MRTPKEQAEAKKKEKDAKVKSYREAMGKIYAKVRGGLVAPPLFYVFQCTGWVEGGGLSR